MQLNYADLNFRSRCSISCALEILGDKWTLLIVRDMMCSKSKFKEFLESPENIPTNILTDRLKQMVIDGLIEKRAYQDKPVRFEYILSEKGRGLIPILQNISQWANLWEPQTWTPPDFFMEMKP